MAMLHLGVVDVAYESDGKPTTTGDVAGYLEDEYHVMRTFLELHEQDIADAVAQQLMGLMENAKMGQPLVIGSIQFDKVQLQFADYIESAEWEKTSGQPTQAAQLGIRHSKKFVYANARGPRPSFLDTGLYKDSFRAWMTR